MLINKILSKKKKTIIKLIFLLLLIVPITVFPSSEEYDAGYRAFIQEDYDRAIKKFLIVTKNDDDPQAWYYLGLSYLNIDEYKKAKKSLLKAQELDKNISRKKKYFQALNRANDALKSIQGMDSNESGPSKSNYFYIIIGVLSGLFISGSVLIFWFLQKREEKRNYKEKPISKELTAALNILNEGFIKAKTKILMSKNEKSIVVIEEIEERCISLNDKQEELKYGLRKIDEETFKDEIELTIEMVNECLENVSFKQKK